MYVVFIKLLLQMSSLDSIWMVMSRRTKILSIEETLVEGESFFTVVKVIIDICLRITIYWIILEDHPYQDLH